MLIRALTEPIKAGHPIVDNLDDPLGGVRLSSTSSPMAFSVTAAMKSLGHFVVDIGFQEGEAHLPHGLPSHRILSIFPWSAAV